MNRFYESMRVEIQQVNRYLNIREHLFLFDKIIEIGR